MYPVVVSDLDGTLLNRQHQLSPRTLQVIEKLSDRGVKFVLATGRHHVDVESLRQRLGMQMYLVTSNGAVVHDPDGKVIIQHNLPEQLMPKLIELGRKYRDQDVVSSTYQGDHWYADYPHQVVMEFSEPQNFKVQIADLSSLPTSNVSKIFYLSKTGDRDALIPLERELKAHFGDQLNITFSLANCLEIMASGISKASALEEVLRLKGFSMADAVAFGDGMNDFEMLQSAGKGLVMGNADPMLKQRLSDFQVIESNQDHGVANYLDLIYAV